MGRVNPPVWCKFEECNKCKDKPDCINRTLQLLEPYRDTQTPFNKRGSEMEITTVAVYLGFCPRLAKYFMEFPSFGSVPVIYSNFISSLTRKPSKQSIQRILLDTLASGDPADITDNIFRYRGIFSSLALGKKEYRLESKNGEKRYTFRKQELDEAKKNISEALDNIKKGVFEVSSPEKQKCSICFLNLTCPKSS